MIRKYRRMLIAVGLSSLLLGTLSWSTPFFLSRWNPDQSRLTPIDDLGGAVGFEDPGGDGGEVVVGPGFDGEEVEWERFSAGCLEAESCRREEVEA